MQLGSFNVMFDQPERQSVQLDSGRLLPKIEALRGSLQLEMKTCGKSTCHCARGDRHGPYWSLRWRENGRQRRGYIAPSNLDAVRAGVAAWRSRHPPARSLREHLTELRRLLRSVDALGG